MEIIKTHTGKIYVDRRNKIECLTVGDYGKENNLKANFLGLTKEINGVENTAVDLTKKWVVTISTQKGCSCGCKFCDVPKIKFDGNMSVMELAYQVATCLRGENVTHTERLNIHFARMGEPTYNRNVINFTRFHLDNLCKLFVIADTIHPVVSTMMPKDNINLYDFLLSWIYIKEQRNGEAGLQLSIQSTDDKQREYQFNGKSMLLNDIAKMAELFPMPVGRKYTLNFAVTEETILDAKLLDSLFDKEKFIVKLTPIHLTNSAKQNLFNVSDTYSDYNVYLKFEQPLLNLGWDVIVFVPSKEEDSDRITCGNALLSNIIKQSL
jgi:23S rRNA (adenine2503-C2)-methyltransferase